MVDLTTASLAALLKQYRAAAALTQEELAERARLSGRTISDLERGIKHHPYSHTVQRLVLALGLSVEDASRFQRAAGYSTSEATATRFHVQRTLPHSLPLQPTPFIGRFQEIEELTWQLCREEVRLLTLTGTGGVGKTRLALRVAEEMQDIFPDGVLFVSLASLADAQLVPATLAASLKIMEGGNQLLLDRLVEYLREKRLLLLLDNFEHLLPAVDTVSYLLTSCSQVKILVTSRAVLHLAAEHDYPVPPLPTPVPGHLPDFDTLGRYDAIQLFLQRAQAIRPGFQLTEDSASTIAEICSRLDGLPLAIELAAARIRLFPPQALLARLRDRLHLLAGGPRDGPTRQQTLRNTIDWSYRLLTPDEQRLFARLSVFAGGCTFEAAEAVCDAEGELDLLAAVGSLVDKSLLRPEGEGEPRFSMLETLREYAVEKLGERNEAGRVRDKHLAIFLDLAEKADCQIHGPAEVTWFRRLETEQDNLRAAMDWAEESGQVESALRLAGALVWFWYARGRWSEGQQRLVRLLALPASEGKTNARALALFGAGLLTASLGNLDAADSYLRRAIALGAELGRDGARVQSLACGFLAFAHATYRGVEIRGLAEESLRLAQESGDRWTAGMAHLAAGVVSHRGGDLDAGRRYHEKGLAIVRGQGDSFSAAPQLYWLANVCRAQGDLRTARARMEEAITTLREIDAKPLLAAVLGAQGSILLEQGEIDQGIALEEEALSLGRECGAPPEIFNAMRYLAYADVLRGDYARAATRYEESLAFARTMGEQTLVALILGLHARVAIRQGDLARARSQCEEGLTLARAVGAETVIPVLLQALGWVARDEGQFEEAAQRLRDALTIARQGGDAMEQLSLIRDVAVIAARSGSAEQAARLLGAEAVLREQMGLALDEAQRTGRRQAAEEARAALGESAWHSVLAAGQAMSLRDAAACALGEIDR